MSLPRPWSGLRAFAPRVDLWPLIDALGGPEPAAVAPPAAWAEVGLPLAALLKLDTPPEPGSWLHPDAPGWPERLRDGTHGPIALAVEGDTSLLAAPCVGIVGARACTTWGRGWARRLAAAVADAGGVVVSGLARGIDAEAHAAAHGRTVAVLGQGLGAGMARWQREARERVLAEGGLVVSEMRHAEPADTFTFPIRNRVIAALSRVVVVVEARRRSGARNTARQATDLGREVLALPGGPDAEVSAGCLDLIEEGATVIRGEESVLRAAKLLGSPTAVLAHVPSEPTSIRELGRRLGLSHDALLSHLGALELLGEVARLPGLRYARIHHGEPPRRPPGHGPSRE